jgi:uncharacterized protein (TIGR03086 family)
MTNPSANPDPTAADSSLGPVVTPVADWRALLADAHEALRVVVAAVPGNAWANPTPCEKWTVTQVLQHAAGDQIGYAAAITGGPWPTEDPFSPSGQLLDDPNALVSEALRRSSTAWSTVDSDATEVPNPLPQGPMPAWLAAGACALDAAMHAWDIAVATGSPSPLTPAMSRDLYTVATQIAEPLRAWGAYAPALPPPADDDVATLLCYLGRSPAWPN